MTGDRSRRAPLIVVIAGPNGAGKTTVSRAVLEETLGVEQFVNADVIARGLAGFNPESAAFEAGRVMLARMDELERQRACFAFETTLASKLHARRIARLHRAGYTSHLVYIWLESAELALRRVRMRVRQGGHDIPEAVVRRRYGRSLRNLFQCYLPRVRSWTILDNSGASPCMVAEQSSAGRVTLHLPERFRSMQELADAQDQTSSDQDPG